MSKFFYNLQAVLLTCGLGLDLLGQIKMISKLVVFGKSILRKDIHPSIIIYTAYPLGAMRGLQPILAVVGQEEGGHTLDRSPAKTANWNFLLCQQL